MFGFIKRGLRKVAHGVASVAHTHLFKEIGGAVAFVVPTHLLSKLPIVGGVAGSIDDLVTMPLRVGSALAQGGRIDRVAFDNLKRAVSDVQAVAPYAQTALSLVPGVGQGLSGAIGAGLALAHGQSITEALAAGVKSALPGGPIAQAAFDVAHAAIQGKPLDAIALAALPVSDEQKALVARGLSVAKDLASGKSVSHELLDQVQRSLPPAVLQGLTMGAAIAHGQVLQVAALAAKQLQHSVDASDHLLAALRDPLHAADAARVLEHTKALALSGNRDAKLALKVLAHREREVAGEATDTASALFAHVKEQQMSWLNNAWAKIKGATKSPVFEQGPMGLSLSFPENAISTNAALTIGAKALAMANSANSGVQARYRGIVANTEALAAQGNAGARRAFQAMKLAKDAKDGNPAAISEVKKIRAHAGHHRLAGQAVMRRYRMHPRTGVLQIRGAR